MYCNNLNLCERLMKYRTLPKFANFPLVYPAKWLDTGRKTSALLLDGYQATKTPCSMPLSN